MSEQEGTDYNGVFDLRFHHKHRYNNKFTSKWAHTCCSSMVSKLMVFLNEKHARNSSHANKLGHILIQKNTKHFNIIKSIAMRLSLKVVIIIQWISLSKSIQKKLIGIYHHFIQIYVIWCPSKNSSIYFLYFIIASRKRFHNQNQFIFYSNWFDEIVVGIMISVAAAVTNSYFVNTKLTI